MRKVVIRTEQELRNALADLKRHWIRKKCLLILQEDIRLTADLVISSPVTIRLNGAKHSLDTDGHRLLFHSDAGGTVHFIG